MKKPIKIIKKLKKIYEKLKNKNIFWSSKLFKTDLKTNLLFQDINKFHLRSLQNQTVSSFPFTLSHSLRFPNLIKFSFFNLSLPFFNSNLIQLTRFHGQCYGYDFNSILADFNWWIIFGIHLNYQFHFNNDLLKNWV